MKKQLIILSILVFSFIGNVQSQDPLIGEIRMFAGNFAPRGWAFCDGQLLPINQNQALFSLLGTIYGGDGITTFGLPDLRGRFAMHAGNGPGLTPRSQGLKSGSEGHTLSAAQLPAHRHVVDIPSAEEGDTDSPAGNFLSGNGINGFKATSDDTLNTFNSGNTGNSQAVDHMPPYTTVRFIIALVGIYPSRS
jgi:microcystin-dependent protein